MTRTTRARRSRWTASPTSMLRLTDELLAGIDHELFPAFAVGVAYTYRKFTDQIFRSRTGLTRADYFLDTTITGLLPDGTAYSAPVFSVTGGADAVPPGMSLEPRRLRSDVPRLDLTLTKRLPTAGWRAAASPTTGTSSTWERAAASIRRTSFRVSADAGNPQTGYTAQTCADDVVVGFRSTGSGDKASVFLSSKWQFYMNAMYQLPLGFNMAGSFFGRQGYPINWWRRVVRTGRRGARRRGLRPGRPALRGRVRPRPPDREGRPDHVFGKRHDLRGLLQRDEPGHGPPEVQPAQPDESAVGNTNDIKEIQSPRVWRFGLRIAF